MLLLALLTRALIPAGIMPGTQFAGAAFVLCGGASAGELIDVAHPAQRQAHADFTCPFAHSAAGAPPPTALRAPHFNPVAAAVGAVAADPRQARTELRRYASPRGPPQPA
jgi:hypothetical protein